MKKQTKKEKRTMIDKLNARLVELKYTRGKLWDEVSAAEAKALACDREIGGLSWDMNRLKYELELLNRKQ